MSNRTMLILAGVLILQVALAVALWLPRQAASVAEPLLAGLEAEQITGLAISDSTGQTVRLARQGDGWVLPEADDYIADGASIEAALAKLVALSRGSVVTETAASHARLQVSDDDFVRRIALETSAGATYVLYMGSSPSYSDAYVRLAGENAVHQGREMSSWEWSSAASGWVDTLYVSVPHEEVTALELANSLGALRLTRLDNGGWELTDGPEGYVLDETAANALVQRATSVRFAAPLGKALLPAYGLDAPLATVMIETDGGGQTMLVGAAQADGNYAVKASTSDYVVSVAPYAVQGLLEASGESLRLQEQPTGE